MTNEVTLLPCPFCGRSDTTKFWRASEMHADCENDGGNDDSVAVVCDAATPNGPGGCGASSGFAATYDEAADRWNKRSVVEPTAECPADHAAMRALCDHFCSQCGISLEQRSHANRQAEPTVNARDAARYRWLRKPNSEIAGPAAYTTYPEHEPIFEQQLDAALDEAIRAENREAKP